MTKTLTAIATEWDVIRNETVAKENTADRVGTAGGDIVEHLQDAAPLNATLSAIPRIFRAVTSGGGFRGDVFYDGQSGWEYRIRTDPGDVILATTRLPDWAIVGFDRGDDWADDGMCYYRCESNGTLTPVTIGGGSSGGGGEITWNDMQNAFELDTNWLMQYAIGVIKVTHINPTTQEEATSVSYAKWQSSQWRWYLTNSMGAQSYVVLNNGTKALLNGKYYILKAAGAYDEDFVMDNTELVSFIANNLPGVIKGRISDDIPTGNVGIHFVAPQWVWTIPKANPSDIGNISINIPAGTRAFNTGVSNIPNVQQNKTYILEGNGTVTPADEPFDTMQFIKLYVGVVTARELSGANDAPATGICVRWFNSLTPMPPSEWRYYPFGVDDGRYITLQPGSVVKVTGDGTGSAVYYELKGGGLYGAITF